MRCKINASDTGVILENYAALSSADPEILSEGVQLWQRFFFSFDEGGGRIQKNTIRGPSSGRKRNDI